MQGMWVQSLVGELRSHMLQGNDVRVLDHHQSGQRTVGHNLKGLDPPI